MDKEELQKNIALYYSKLPPEAQTAFSSMLWLETLKNIAQKYNLSETQIETLGTETTLVLLGIVHPDEYEATLRNELLLSGEAIDNIISEIENLILKDVRPQITEAFEINNEGGQVESTNELQIGEGWDTRLEKLPKEVQNAVRDTDYRNVLYTIAREQGLNIEQMGTLEDSVMDVMLATIPTEKFEETLQKRLELNADKARELVAAINDRILKKIREKMMATAPKQINKEEVQVLHSAGIKILDPNLNTLELKAGDAGKTVANNVTPTPIVKAPEPTPAILNQKFSTSFQVPTVKTEHVVEPPVTPTPEVKPKLPKVDPYREVPE